MISQGQYKFLTWLPVRFCDIGHLKKLIIDTKYRRWNGRVWQMLSVRGMIIVSNYGISPPKLQCRHSRVTQIMWELWVLCLCRILYSLVHWMGLQSYGIQGFRQVQLRLLSTVKGHRELYILSFLWEVELYILPAEDLVSKYGIWVLEQNDLSRKCGIIKRKSQPCAVMQMDPECLQAVWMDRLKSTMLVPGKSCMESSIRPQFWQWHYRYALWIYWFWQ